MDSKLAFDAHDCAEHLIKRIRPETTLTKPLHGSSEKRPLAIKALGRVFSGLSEASANVYGINKGRAVTLLFGVVRHAGTGTRSPC
jgi:hypothetical protein